MKQLLILITALLVLTSEALPRKDTLLNNGSPCPAGTWELVFSDEFDDNSLDTEKWTTWYPYSDDGSDRCEFCRTHGTEGQIYKDENVIVSDGILNLIARLEPAAWYSAQRGYTSGMIHSRQAFGIGKYEIRCRLPKGMGFWPAIWAYGGTSAELDILEAGMQHPRRFHTSIHNRQIRKMLHQRHRGMEDLSAGFHTFTMEWDSAFIRFSVDDVIVRQLSLYLTRNGRRIKQCPVKPGNYRIEPVFPPAGEKVQLILNLAIGSESTPFTKSPDARTVFPDQMEIDWIRIYRRK